ncbi:hypothetical protein INR49_012537 [Caranx melampygus]|nr:hypothetical protein INR49_012537 [Caranx melampygus]
MDELDTYQHRSNQKSVLLFPSLPSRLRYLIHRTIEDLPELASFSVGESWCRRVVVCHSELRGEIEEDSDLESNNSLCEEPLRIKEEMDSFAKPKSSIPSRSRGPKRPDKPLYMPRAARERLSQNSPGTTAFREKPSPSCSSCGHISSSSDSCSCNETSESTKPSSTSRQDSHPGVTDSVLNHISDNSACCPPEERQKLVLRLHETEPPVWDETVSCFGNMTLEEDIRAHLKEAVSFSVEHVHNDYSIYENVCINADEFRHVIEIYDFPSMFKTDDLLDAFTEYRVYPASEGASQDRLCCCQADGDQSPGTARTRQSAALLKRSAHTVGVYSEAQQRSAPEVIIKSLDYHPPLSASLTAPS